MQIEDETDTPEVAVVMVSFNGEGHFVMGRGPYIECDIDAGLGTHEIGPVTLAPQQPGLWIWEGHPGWVGGGPSWASNPSGDDGGEPVYEGRGAWRRPMPEEASRIVSGDFTLFGPPRLEGGEVEESTSGLFAGLAAHVESETPLPPGSYTATATDTHVDEAGRIHLMARVEEKKP